jgi:hypothetical protein
MSMSANVRRALLGLAGAVAAIAVGGGLAAAAEQTILGKTLSVKDSSSGVDPLKRGAAASAGEKSSPNTIVGDPTLAGSAGGAILEIFLNGANSSNQVFVLPQGTSSQGKPFWSGSLAKGFKYKDPKGDNGAVKTAAIKKSGSGTFVIKAKLKGKQGPMTVVPPNPGTSGCVALKLGISAGAGDRYSIQFGADGIVSNSGAKTFKVKKPTLQGVCPGAAPTTTTTTTTSTTTTTTMYGSPSRAFLSLVPGLLD